MSACGYRNRHAGDNEPDECMLEEHGPDVPHRAWVEWVTDLRDIPHVHEWEPKPERSTGWVHLGPDPGPAAFCTFCQQEYLLAPSAEFVAFERAMFSAIFR